MRKITYEAVSALYSKKNYHKSNTEVIYIEHKDKSYMYLFGNCIAIYNHTEDEITISTCGYPTNTTKERLNALEGVDIYQRDFQWYLNGELWNGKEATLDSYGNILYKNDRVA